MMGSLRLCRTVLVRDRDQIYWAARSSPRRGDRCLGIDAQIGRGRRDRTRSARRPSDQVLPAAIPPLLEIGLLLGVTKNESRSFPALNKRSVRCKLPAKAAPLPHLRNRDVSGPVRPAIRLPVRRSRRGVAQPATKGRCSPNTKDPEWCGSTLGAVQAAIKAEPHSYRARLTSRRWRWPRGRTHEGEYLVGGRQEQQAIADRRRREVVRKPPKRIETTWSPLAGFRPCTALSPPIGIATARLP